MKTFILGLAVLGLFGIAAPMADAASPFQLLGTSVSSQAPVQNVYWRRGYGYGGYYGGYRPYYGGYGYGGYRPYYGYRSYSGYRPYYGGYGGYGYGGYGGYRGYGGYGGYGPGIGIGIY